MRVLVSLLFPMAVAAQPLDTGTYDVFSQDISAEGVLEGCSLVFTAVTNDYAYMQGQPVILNGSIGVRTLGRADLLLTGKLGTNQWRANGLGEWQAPSHFYFYTKHGTTAGHAKITQAENSGYRLLIGRATERSILTLVEEMADQGGFSIGFNRHPGGQDVTADIDIYAKVTKDSNGMSHRVRSSEAATAYANCFSRLLSDLQRRINGK